ncbi:hypothetical protein K0M31_018836 [Melipona bicolor]|uniref:Uncharacterized protein n=1 Tax=Melipona bicolor TaxID=60889 RepID=A0AA40G4D3_9HYME|nr:hypothetical protein K0M31_018836 [Melipona bicolor]
MKVKSSKQRTSNLVLQTLCLDLRVNGNGASNVPGAFPETAGNKGSKCIGKQ